jgi:hypothetical protein
VGPGLLIAIGLGGPAKINIHLDWLGQAILLVPCGLGGPTSINYNRIAWATRINIHWDWVGLAILLVPCRLGGPTNINYESLFIRNRSIIFGAHQKMVGSSFRLIISFTTNCVTVGIKVLKLCFTSEFKISRGADLEHFRKVFPTVQLSATVYPQYLDEYCSDSHAN